VSDKSSIDLKQDPKVIIGTRVFNAPRALLFEAWTQPRNLAQWWGPNGFSISTHSFDFRPGRIWRFVMHGPDGRDYQNRITFDEIVRPERIAYHHGGGDDVEPVQFRTLVSFEDIGGKTRLTMRATFPSAKERDRVIREYGADKGLVQTLTRLGEHVGKLLAARPADTVHVQPYLFFDGRCEEALEFYRKALGAEIDMLVRFKDSPEPPDPEKCAPGSGDKVMHASFRIGGASMMASDGRAHGQPKFQGFSLSLFARNEAEADRMFNALADGGEVQMPLGKTFFSPRFGMVGDRFGVGWMVLVKPEPRA
jgi:PhnB protein